MQQTMTHAPAAPATSPQTPQALAEALQAAGWLPGAPAHVSDQTRAIDRRVCRALRCPGCRTRGLSYRPFHQGNRYRVVAACPVCPVGEEV